MYLFADITHNNKKNIIELAIFLISLLARFVKLLVDPILLRDSTLYLNYVFEWNDTASIQSILEKESMFPVFPIYLIRQLTFFVYNEEIAGRSLSIFLGALIPLICFKIFIKFFSCKIALATSILVIFHPLLLIVSVQPMRESYYLLFSLLFFQCFVCYLIHKHLFTLCFASFFCTAAIFSRYETLEFIFYIPFILFVFSANKKLSLKNAGYALLVFYFSLLVFMIVFSVIIGSDFSFLRKVYIFSEG